MFSIDSLGVKVKPLQHRQLKAYRWRGSNREGKSVSGRMVAFSEIEVRSELQQQQIGSIKITPRSISLLERYTQRVTAKDITLLTRHITTMLITGMPMISILKLVSAHHQKGEMKSILNRISAKIEAGLPLSQAMRASSPHFDALYCDLVATGEQTGKLVEVFERIAIYREKSQRLKTNIIKALIYPSMVMLTAFVVCYLMLTLVIPQFESIFAGFGAQLPWLTRQVLKLSALSQKYAGMLLISVSIMLLLLNRVTKRSRRAQLMYSSLLLKIPVIGQVLRQAIIARFSRTLATGFNAGLPILCCLKTATTTAGNLYYQEALEKVCSNTASGMPMFIAMRLSNAFPEMVLQMVMIGEESGRLDDMLNKIADIYEANVEQSVDTLGKVLEPLIILFLGVTVGGLVVAMYLPIFNLMNVLG